MSRCHKGRCSGPGPDGTLLGVIPVGEVSEWLKEHAWKACVRETVPRVRIPPSPPRPYISDIATFFVDLVPVFRPNSGRLPMLW